MAPRISGSLFPFLIRPFLIRALAGAGIVLATHLAAQAQSGVLAGGDALTTQFSGFRPASGDRPLPDPDGGTVRAYTLGAPDVPADGALWTGPSVLISLTARQTGQVFGTVFDTQSPADAYLAASSAYGLYRTADDSDWADGMWGPGGGPSTIWKLDAEAGYRPEVFATLNPDNGGAGLGGLVHDRFNRQLFAADLQTGLIHRVDGETGETIQTFDHGLDGRSYFLDVSSGQYLVLDVVVDASGDDGGDDEGGAGVARYDDCTDADGTPSAFWRTPDCWGYADFRRRVWGLGLQRDPITDTVRLYYSVWGGAALGDPGWDVAGDDARTSIWSVGLDGNGGFDVTDIRREVLMPPLVPEEEGAAQAESPPVTGIAFAADGAMLVAERGRPAPGSGQAPTQVIQPEDARAFLFVRNEDGVWETEGRYDVGFAERGPGNRPHIRANAAGGAAFGPGYGEDGRIDTDAPEATVWLSADPLCSETGPCIDPETGEPSVTGPFGGMQATPVSATSDLVPPVAMQAYPAAGGPVTGDETLTQSYLVPVADTGAIVGAMGDIAFYPPERVISIVEAPEDVPLEPAGETPQGVTELPPALPDLALAKTGLGGCAPGTDCLYEISVSNAGPVAYSGPILITDTIGAPNVSLAGATPEPWGCFAADGNVFCQYPTVTLEPGDSLAFNLTLRPGIGHSSPRLENCADLTWLGAQGRDRIRAVQAELQRRGFVPGTADGIMGPRTAAAIREAEQAAGLAATGTITEPLIEVLFGPGAAQAGDASPGNDRDCGIVAVDVPPPPSHQVQVSSFHRRFDSVNHDPITSAPIDLHDVDLSYFHRTWRSSLHDVTYSQPIPIHRPALSQFHLTWRSGLHDGLYSSLVPVHSVAISTFHGSYKSIRHDYLNSSLAPIHRVSLSGFHRSWTSSRHDGYVTRILPVHRNQLSAFHRKYGSALHDHAVTRLRPVHGRAVSSFHYNNESRLHDPLTTRLKPVHRPAVSNFHHNRVSSLHNPNTSKVRPGHNTAISRIHKTHSSGQHQPRTTQLRPIHGRGVSDFHRGSTSVAHNVLTSAPRDIHLGTMSRFHRNNKSAVHNPATTGVRPTHQPAVSTFHTNNRSGQHQPRTSSGTSPAHRPAVSGFHRDNRSGQHNARTSGSVSPGNPGKPGHNARVSQAQQPVHSPARSQSIGKPGQPVHSPAQSRSSNTRPTHNANRSQAQQPVHSPARSQSTSKPGQPVHAPAQSRASNTKPAHNANVSRAQKPAHSSAKSQQSRPSEPKQPAHATVASQVRQQQRQQHQQQQRLQQQRQQQQQQQRLQQQRQQQQQQQRLQQQRQQQQQQQRLQQQRQQQQQQQRLQQQRQQQQQQQRLQQQRQQQQQQQRLQQQRQQQQQQQRLQQQQRQQQRPKATQQRSNQPAHAKNISAAVQQQQRNRGGGGSGGGAR